MTRKMTKKEFMTRWKPSDNHYGSLFRKELNALVRAVEERCAEVAETFKDKYVSSEPFVNGVIVSIAEDIAAAIRKGGR